MFDAPAYLAWAIAEHGRARFDLATSGIPPLRVSELTAMGATLDLDDASARERLRAAIARHLAVEESTVIAALGTAHAVWLAYAALTSPGDEILVEAPTYEPLLRAAEGMGARVTRFDRPRGEGYAIDPDRVEATMTARTRVVAVSNLHNPTGVRAPDAVLAALAERVARRGAWLFVDEVYAPFDGALDGAGVWSGSARRLGERVVCAASLTKCYGLGAQRIGWLSGPREALARAEAAILSTAGMLPLAHAAVGVAAFDVVPALAARAKALLGAKLDVARAWVASRPDLGWSAPTEGLFGFVHARESAAGARARETAPGARGADVSSGLPRAIAHALEVESVLVVPGAFFEMPDGFRLAWSADDATFSAGLRALGRSLDAPPP